MFKHFFNTFFLQGQRKNLKNLCSYSFLAFKNLKKTFPHGTAWLKGIVSRDFEWLQIILINRLCVPDVPLEVYSFLNFRFHIVFIYF